LNAKLFMQQEGS